MLCNSISIALVTDAFAAVIQRTDVFLASPDRMLKLADWEQHSILSPKTKFVNLSLKYPTLQHFSLEQHQYLCTAWTAHCTKALLQRTQVIVFDEVYGIDYCSSIGSSS